jgi:hypothetical protein
MTSSSIRQRRILLGIAKSQRNLFPTLKIADPLLEQNEAIIKHEEEV